MRSTCYLLFPKSCYFLCILLADKFQLNLMESKEGLSPCRQKDFMSLPNEIATDILSRLPPETVGQCRTLSKQFYNLTSGPQFVDLHLLKSKCRSPRILLTPNLFSAYQHHYWACLDEGCFKKIPYDGRFSNDLIAHSSCNGLLCMSKFYTNYNFEPVVIHNPTTRESAKLPNSMIIPRILKERLYGVNVGIGYDYVHEKYKVVRIYSKREDDYSKVVTAEIITLGESSWRRLILPSGLKELSQQTFHNGAFYWFSSFLEQECILVFEISNEMFHTIEFSTSPENPFLDPGRHSSELGMTKFGEFVCLVDLLPRAPTDPLRMWKITGNNTTGYRLCCLTVEFPDMMQKPGRDLQFSSAYTDESYLFTGTEVCIGNGGSRNGVLALLNIPKNEESSVKVQYAVGELVHFHILLVEPSLVSPSTLIKAQGQDQRLLVSRLSRLL